MAYFNHAFQKVFLATGDSTTVPVRLLNDTTVSATTSGALLTTIKLPTYALNEISAANNKDGYVGIFNPKTNLSIIPKTAVMLLLLDQLFILMIRLDLSTVVIKRLTSLK
jgi:hypothetical protein